MKRQKTAPLFLTKWVVDRYCCPTCGPFEIERMEDDVEATIDVACPTYDRVLRAA